MARERILVIDDEDEISELIRIYLEKEQYKVFIAANGEEAIRLTRLHQPDLIILDILLPDQNGLDVCLKLRAMTHSPIIFVSCKGEDIDKIIGLTVGGDDYITKPFSPGELVARVKAQFRRTQINVNTEATTEQLRFANLEIDLASHEVTIDGTKILLSATEFNLLAHMAKQPGRVYPIAKLYELIWGLNSVGDTRTVMVHMSNLRKKIEINPAQPQYIQTVRGTGYKFIQPALKTKQVF